MPTLTIDNRRIEVPAGIKVIEAAERAGIVIPRFCYHPALGSVGACRVCAVMFKEGPVSGIQMSCMITAQDGMVVATDDPEAVDFRRHVIEWLMLNHPHDCPVCDEGGHCLLQDMTIAGGHGRRRYQGLKRTHRNQDLGPLVRHEMNRCIQCYRCSRYYQEFSGYRDLGVMGIGSRVYFGRRASGILESPFAGNLVDLCPTGVYTDRPSRYMGRRWDFQRAPSICLHCSLGCNLTVSARYRQVVRHEARVNTEVNGHFICDRGRYGYAYAGEAARPRKPMLDGKETDTETAVANARVRIEQAVTRYGPRCVALALSPGCSLETLAAADQVCRRRQWSGPAIVSTEREAANLKAAVTRLTPELAVSLGAVSVAHQVMVIGADPINEAPMLALNLRQAVRQGGHVTVIDPRAVVLPMDFDHWPVSPSRLGPVLRGLIGKLSAVKAPSDSASDNDLLDDAFPVASLAERLAGSRRVVLVCGTDIPMPGEIELVGRLAEALKAKDVDAKLFFTLSGANAFGAALASTEISSLERVCGEIEAGRIRVLVLADTCAWHMFPQRKRFEGALEKLDHLIVLDHVDSPLIERAGCFLPTRTLYESGGCLINQEARLQEARAVMAGGESIALSGKGDHPPRRFEDRIPGGRPQDTWRLLMQLGHADQILDDEDRPVLPASAFSDYHAALAVLDGDGMWNQRIPLEAVAAARDDAAAPMAPAPVPLDGLSLLLVDRTFGTEPLSSRTSALRVLESEPEARLHPGDMKRLGIADGRRIVVTTPHGRLALPVRAEERMAPGVLVIPRNHRLEWQVLGGRHMVLSAGQVQLEVHGGVAVETTDE